MNIALHLASVYVRYIQTASPGATLRSEWSRMAVRFYASGETDMSSTTTSIEWTDATWNPMTGCTKISAGCDHCYAHTLAHTKTRANYLRQLPVKDTAENRADPFAPRFWEARLLQPLSWRQPRRIFVNSMSDVFHAHF